MKLFFVSLAFSCLTTLLWGQPQEWPNYNHKTHLLQGNVNTDFPEINEENNVHFVRFHNAFQNKSRLFSFNTIHHLKIQIKGEIKDEQIRFLQQIYPHVEALTLAWDGITRKTFIAENLIQYLNIFSNLHYLDLEYPLGTGTIAEILREHVEDIPEHVALIKTISHAEQSISGADFIAFINQEIQQEEESENEADKKDDDNSSQEEDDSDHSESGTDSEDHDNSSEEDDDSDHSESQSDSEDRDNSSEEGSDSDHSESDTDSGDHDNSSEEEDDSDHSESQSDSGDHNSSFEEEVNLSDANQSEDYSTDISDNESNPEGIYSDSSIEEDL